MDLLENLNKEQIEAVTHKEGPCLVIAGAGTGKTTVITRRIAYLIEQGIVKPEEIVALTFTDKAAREMEERVDQLVAYGQTGSQISTFHSFANEILRNESHLFGLPANFSLLTTAEEIVLARKFIFDFNFKTLKPSTDPTIFLSSFIKFISRLKDENVYPEEFQRFIEGEEGKDDKEGQEEQITIWQDLAGAYKIYQERLETENALSFADLIPKVLNLFSAHPQTLKRISQSIKFLLIDEYQDTNWSQTSLASRLVEMDPRNIFVVGDDDQAIYGFRGAAVGNILAFKKTFPQAKIIALTDNYRSSQNILDLAYRTIQLNNPYRLEYQEKINKRLIAQKNHLDPEFNFFSSSLGESSFIANKIREVITLNKKKTYTYSDVAILIRSRHHGESIRTTLKALGIPHVLVSDRRFYELPIIKLILCFFRILANPYDNPNLYYVLTNPYLGIQELELKNSLQKSKYYHRHLLELIKDVKNDDLFEPESREKLEQFMPKLVILIQRAKDESPAHILLLILHELGLYEYLINQKTGEAEEQIEQIGTLYEAVTGFEEKHPRARIDDFIEYLDSVIDSGEDIAPPEIDKTDYNAVKIMTIHQSKGLEFPIVFLPSLARNRFPSINRSESFVLPKDLVKELLPLTDVPPLSTPESHLAEERRLFYVACTRAKDLLFLTAAEKYGASERKSKISPFVLEAFGEDANQKPAQVSQADILQLSLPLAPLDKDNPKAKSKISEALISSPSKLETYQNCPYKYRYQYVIKLKVMPSWHLNFGIFFHSVIRAYYSLLKDQPVDTINLDKLIDEYWTSGGFENPTHEEQKKQQAVEAVKKFIETEQGKKVPDSMEEKFTLELPSKDKIFGRVDRLDFDPDGKTIISDYKTSARAKSAEDIKKDIQLGIYTLALTDKKKFVTKIGHIYPLIGKEVYIDVTAESLQEMKEKVKRLVSQIKQSEATDEFKANPSKFNCDYCDYKKICPYRYN